MLAMRRSVEEHTGPMAVRAVSSRTFSIRDLLESYGGGLMSVPAGILMALSDKS